MFVVFMVGLFFLSFSQTANDRVPLPAESPPSAFPQDKLEEFKKNAVFGPMERVR